MSTASRLERIKAGVAVTLTQPYADRPAWVDAVPPEFLNDYRAMAAAIGAVLEHCDAQDAHAAARVGRPVRSSVTNTTGVRSAIGKALR